MWVGGARQVEPAPYAAPLTATNGREAAEEPLQLRDLPDLLGRAGAGPLATRPST
jgi:hypothetical protein